MKNSSDSNQVKKSCSLSDDAWDSIAAVALITITVCGVVYWLSNI